MFEHKTIQSLEEYFNNLTNRREKGVFFYRINGYNEKIGQFIQMYYEAARRSGVIIEGKIQNPTEENLAYYDEIMGTDFQMSIAFIEAGLKKWLPRMSDYQRKNVSASIYDTLDLMRRSGKNENMLKNAYIKFMCWLYYKFERIVSQLGNDVIPKILYEGEISNYELKLITILSNAGCDVILLQYHGDQSYSRLDPRSQISAAYQADGLAAFPKEFNLKQIQKDREEKVKQQHLYGTLPKLSNATNTWIEGKGMSELCIPPKNRGSEPDFYYNCFIRIEGVSEKTSYMNELFELQLDLKNNGRSPLILERTITPPSMEEVNRIKRGNYKNKEQMILSLCGNIRYSANIELQRIMVKAFVDIILQEDKKAEMNLNRLMNKAIYLLCWLNRYRTDLFSDWKMPKIGCFIYLGGCKNENEAMFVSFLARLPLDVLILVPNLNETCCLTDDLLYELHYPDSLAVQKYPREDADIRMGTAAYHAERELDTLMYEDSGIYRNRQYKKAVSLTLQTMYEEIPILWDQELKYRPNFNVTDNTVHIPVICSKISGVKEESVNDYWLNVKKLIQEDTFVIKKAPFIKSEDPNPMKSFAVTFFKNGKLLRQTIKNHKAYPYGLLRDEVQDYILDKLELLIERRLIKGTFENGTEYTIIAVVLNLKQDIVRLIQKFDFTKKNPKVIYINTAETKISLEDSIMIAFLNLLGFDCLFFIPTGYQSVETYFNERIMEEHQVGDYHYDLRLPDFEALSLGIRSLFRKKIFKRGD